MCGGIQRDEGIEAVTGVLNPLRDKSLSSGLQDIGVRRVWEELGIEKAEEKAAREDELLPKAIEVVRQDQRASISMLQRRLRIGYSRAARLIETMEKQGIIGPDQRVACVLTGHPLKDPNLTVNYHKERQGQFSNPPIEVPNDLDEILKLIK